MSFLLRSALAILAIVVSVARPAAAMPIETSGDYPDSIYYGFAVGLYTPTPLTSLRLRVGWGYWPDYISCTPATQLGSASGIRTARGQMEWEFEFGSAGSRHTQRILFCGLSVWHAEAGWKPEVEILDARDTNGERIDVTGSLCLDCARDNPDGYGAPERDDYDDCGWNICGDVISDDSLTASDALRVLRAAVGLQRPFYRHRYDTDGNGRIAADDALRVLRRALDLPADLFCDPPPAAQCSVPKIGVDDYEFTIRLEAADLPVGALNVTVEYQNVFGSFQGAGALVDCDNVAPGALVAMNHVESAKQLHFGWIALEPFSAPVDLTRCRFRGSEFDPPLLSDFIVTVTEAADIDVHPIGVTVAASLEKLD